MATALNGLREKIEELVRGPASRCPSHQWTIYRERGEWSYVGHPGTMYRMGDEQFRTPIIFGGLKYTPTDEEQIQDEIESVYEAVSRRIQEGE